MLPSHMHQCKSLNDHTTHRCCDMNSDIKLNQSPWSMIYRWKWPIFAWMLTYYPTCICVQDNVILQVKVAEIWTQILNLTKTRGLGEPVSLKQQYFSYFRAINMKWVIRWTWNDEMKNGMDTRIIRINEFRLPLEKGRGG